MAAVLVIYTSTRRDCFLTCARSLEKNTDLSRFEKIYVITNDVSYNHLSTVTAFTDAHANAEMRFCAPRGLVPAVMREMNDILARHADDVVVKLDEDVFVTPGWLDSLLANHAEHKDSPEVIMGAALCPVSANGLAAMRGFWEINFPKELRLVDSFKKSLDQNKYYHRYAWEMVLNKDLAGRWREFASEPYLYQAHIVINCIVFDRRLIERIHPLPEEKIMDMGCVDEITINETLKQGHKVALSTNPLVHHYSHWRSEKYLRKHVPMASVYEHLLNEPAPPEVHEPLIDPDQPVFNTETMRSRLPISVVKAMDAELKQAVRAANA